MACGKVTDAMCKEDAWKAILAEDCPSSCGLCNAVGMCSLQNNLLLFLRWWLLRSVVGGV
ncbi:unnamed protein product [Heligmosomoides polygyrus]|uniref:ShKT domain-containing protein n=1 Tax=Heligmosomoides polygyrus TaxID=6339 RepID=A0A183FBQ6_HELPZ|nr:unnamed protein product [Heligmosomoides polygyrus]